MARRKTAHAAPPVPAPRLPAWLTPARRRELTGALLVVLAVVTLVAFASPTGGVSRSWIAALRWLLGWAAPLAPLALGGLGAWLVVDVADGHTDVRWDRVLGGVVLLVAVVGLLHLAADLAVEDATGRQLAEQQRGGGWLGFAVANGLTLNLGTAPAVALLAALAALGASLASGRTVRDTGALAGRGARAVGGAVWARRSVGAPARGRRGDEPVPPLEAPPSAEVPDTRPGRAPGPTPGSQGAASSAAGTPPHGERAAGASAGAETIGPSRLAGRARHPWPLPRADQILDPAPEDAPATDDVGGTAALLERTLGEFGIPARVVKIERGPTVTLFGVEPGLVERNGERARVRVSRIVALQNDLALALSASPIRIQAPVPGRPFVGIEVPNAAKSMVSLRGVLESDVFAQAAAKTPLPIALGRDTSGRPVAADLAAMPHLLVAGATGSGKSVAVNAIICTLLMTHTPETLRMVLVDPKRVELVGYRGLPHLASPVVVDVEQVIGVLQWAVREMDRRYKAFAEVGARNLEAYNRRAGDRGEPLLPFLIVIIDELADLMMVAPEDAERLITRLAQLARATGIHLVLATQRPSVDVVTGLIKANFPARIAFAVSSSIDSRVILDSVGAEKLLGRGDMLYMASDSSKLRRLQGCYVSDAEIDRLVRFWRQAAAQVAASPAGAATTATGPLVQPELFVDPAAASTGSRQDPLFAQAVDVVLTHRTASTSFLQRKLRIGYSRAARLLDELEAAGYVTKADGNQPRDVISSGGGPAAGGAAAERGDSAQEPLDPAGGPPAGPWSES